MGNYRTVVSAGELLLLIGETAYTSIFEQAIKFFDSEAAFFLESTIGHPVNDLIDITPEFAFNPALIVTNQQQQAALLQFKPTSDVDPVRYWQVILYFTWTQDFSAGYAPQLRIQASYY